MTILINFGDKFKLNPNIKPDGSMILAGTIPMPMLERSKFDQYPHMRVRYFDPQLYLAQLDPNQSKGYCSTLASYPWFGAQKIKKFKSDLQKRADWRREVKTNILSLWPRAPLSPGQNADLIIDAVRECIEFQLRIGCRAIILPSPLTYNPNTDYQDETFWLDTALQYISGIPSFDKPVYATLAITDGCLKYSAPNQNHLLDLILDVVSARKIDGVYLVIEQAGESEFDRQLGNTNTIWSALHITHLLTHDCHLQVGVNFFGALGLILEAAGADFWASGWYKSRYRFRLADKIGQGRAFPLFWSHPAAADIHMKSDFDNLVTAGFIGTLAQSTPASSNLIFAVEQGASSDDVLEWEYSPSRITAATEHYFYSIIDADRTLSALSKNERLDFIENKWLVPAAKYAQAISQTLGSRKDTKTEHVQSWLDALRRFRDNQNV